MLELRLLTHAVELDAGEWERADAVRFLGGTAGEEMVPELVRTRCALRRADRRAGRIELFEDGGRLGDVRGLDAAVATLGLRLRRRVLDLAAHSGWLPLRAGFAVVCDRHCLVLGGTERGALLAHARASGATVTAGDVVLVRAGAAIGYPVPLRMRRDAADGLPPDTKLGDWRPDGARLEIRKLSEPIPPAPVDTVVIVADIEADVDGALDAPGTSDVLAALLDARIDTGVGSRRADVTAASALVRGLRGAVRIPSGPPARSGSSLVATAGGSTS